MTTMPTQTTRLMTFLQTLRASRRMKLQTLLIPLAPFRSPLRVGCPILPSTWPLSWSMTSIGAKAKTSCLRLSPSIS